MSAFMVSDNHVNFLVRAAVERGLLSPGLEQAAGAMLIRANRRSLACRYGKEPRRAKPYHYTPTSAPVEDATLLKACRCYNYQACETPRYEKTRAARFVARICATIPAGLEYSQAYEDAPWGL